MCHRILNGLLSAWFWAYSLPGNEGKQHKGQAGVDPVYESFSFSIQSNKLLSILRISLPCNTTRQRWAWGEKNHQRKNTD